MGFSNRNYTIDDRDGRTNNGLAYRCMNWAALAATKVTTSGRSIWPASRFTKHFTLESASITGWPITKGAYSTCLYISHRTKM